MSFNQGREGRGDGGSFRFVDLPKPIKVHWIAGNLDSVGGDLDLAYEDSNMHCRLGGRKTNIEVQHIHAKQADSILKPHGWIPGR